MDVVTEVSLKIAPIARHRSVRVVLFATVEDGVL
jgi:hypothetical protein